MGTTSSANSVNGAMITAGNPNTGIMGSGISIGTSYGMSLALSPNLGITTSESRSSGGGNSTSAIQGGDTTAAMQLGVINVNSYGDFVAGGAGMATFGSPLSIAGTSMYVPGISTRIRYGLGRNPG
jgi:hypothetical protein